MLIATAEEAELRDNALGQVVKLGEAAAVIVGLLDGDSDAAAVLAEAGKRLGGPLDPMGLVDLLQALDQRALLDTPRARAIVSRGLIRADVASLRRLSQRRRTISSYEGTEAAPVKSVRMAPESKFSCNSCTRCCTDKHLLGPLSGEEVKKIIDGYKAAGKAHAASHVDFMPLPNDGQPPVSYLLRTTNGLCNFLQEDGKCGIHQDLGIESKPAVCRLFPYRAVHTPTGWDVGLTLSCPTVAAGHGDDPQDEVLVTINSLKGSSPLLQVISDTVNLDANCKVPYSVYAAWEAKAVEILLAEPSRPAQAWLSVINSFEELRATHGASEAMDPWLNLSQDADCQTMEMPEAAGEDGLISERGQGDMSQDIGLGADILLRDLATWLELLVGLEAADPMALRRVRSGIVRLRSDLDVSGSAAPVLAERARLGRISANVADTLDEVDTVDSVSANATRPSIRSVKLTAAGDEEVRLRFLYEALVGKSLFAFSSVRHGLVSLSVHLGLLRLEGIHLDPMSPDVSDVSYLFQHPQFIDVIDSRAVVRHHGDDGALHRAILGISLAD
jgi:Fe-S-cluster containining protein